ncbi:MAG: hypothetical protein WCR55_11580 [Lentisphaerota bacterium]
MINMFNLTDRYYFTKSKKGLFSKDANTLWGFKYPQDGIIDKSDLEVINDLLLPEGKDIKLLIVACSCDHKTLLGSDLYDELQLDSMILLWKDISFNSKCISILGNLWKGYYCSRIYLLSGDSNFVENAFLYFKQLKPSMMKMNVYFKKFINRIPQGGHIILEVGHDGICLFVDYSDSEIKERFQLK